MASSDVVQFAGCCCAKCFPHLFNTEFGILSRKDPQAKIVSAKSRKGIGNSTNEKATESDYKPTVNCTCGNGTMRGQKRRKCRDCLRDTCNQAKTLPLLPFEKRS